MISNASGSDRRTPWNKGKIVGQKAPFRLKDIWAIRVRLQLGHRARELALFDLGIDSKLRGCDLLKLKVSDVCHGTQVAARATVMQQKTQRPVQFEITTPTREAVGAWITEAHLRSEDCLFPSRVHKSGHLGTRQYARILDGWVRELGLDPCAYGTHSMRRTKATLIYRKTRNLRAVQLLLGHTKLESTVRYLGIEVDDAIEIAEQIEVLELRQALSQRPPEGRTHMPNIASVLKSEITRLARKEVRDGGGGLRKTVAAHRAEIASLKKRLSDLESVVKRLTKGTGSVTKQPTQSAADAATEPDSTGLRFRAKGMAANRQRLGLSAADFGLLVGATGQSIYAWEAGKTKPKPAALAAIAALRGVGKREVEDRLASLKGR